MQLDDDTPRPPSAFALAWRQTLRDFRAGELRLLLVAVTLAVGRAAGSRR
jgi:putative ABC transport system permease protein